MKAVISNFSITKTHYFIKTLPGAIFILFLFSCNTSKIDSNQRGIGNIRYDIANTALAQSRASYKYGGMNPKEGFDCSGFTYYVFSKNGINLPRTSKAQSKIGKKIKLKNVRLGDLIFFDNNGKINHVGIVLENQNNHLVIIHSTTSEGVKKDNVLNNKYWKKRITFAIDVISD